MKNLRKNLTVSLVFVGALGITLFPILRDHFAENGPFSGNYQAYTKALTACKEWAKKLEKKRICHPDRKEYGDYKIMSNTILGHSKDCFGCYNSKTKEYEWKIIRRYKWN